jgi:hypothetical protein
MNRIPSRRHPTKPSTLTLRWYPRRMAAEQPERRRVRALQALSYLQRGDALVLVDHGEQPVVRVLAAAQLRGALHLAPPRRRRRRLRLRTLQRRVVDDAHHPEGVARALACSPPTRHHPSESSLSGAASVSEWSCLRQRVVFQSRPVSRLRYTQLGVLAHPLTRTPPLGGSRV